MLSRKLCKPETISDVNILPLQLSLSQKLSSVIFLFRSTTHKYVVIKFFHSSPNARLPESRHIVRPNAGKVRRGRVDVVQEVGRGGGGPVGHRHRGLGRHLESVGTI